MIRFIRLCLMVSIIVTRIVCADVTTNICCRQLLVKSSNGSVNLIPTIDDNRWKFEVVPILGMCADREQSYSEYVRTIENRINKVVLEDYTMDYFIAMNDLRLKFLCSQLEASIKLGVLAYQEAAYNACKKEIDSWESQFKKNRIRLVFKEHADFHDFGINMRKLH